ncbi:unnamed protein product [Boreogadus saida]
MEKVGWTCVCVGGGLALYMFAFYNTMEGFRIRTCFNKSLDLNCESPMLFGVPFLDLEVLGPSSVDWMYDCVMDYKYTHGKDVTNRLLQRRTQSHEIINHSRA